MTMQGEIRPGYKQTDVGVIPEGWEGCTLGAVVEFLDGQRRPVKSGDRAKMRGVYPYYGASGIVDYVNVYLFDEELILLGEDGENILSRNLPLAFRVSGKIWVNNHAHVMRPSSRVDIGYLTEFLESLDYSDYNSGTAQPKLNKQSCVRLPVVVPPLPEQRAIAAALADADGLIAALEGMISKKRDLKQAAMQHLLTGKTRLPGFSGEWAVKRLGEVAQIIGGGTPKSSVPAYWDGGIQWCTPTDITGTQGKYLGRTDRTISEDGLKKSAATLLPPGSLLLCTRATLGEVKIAVAPICTNQGFKSLVCHPGVSNEYMYYLLLTMKQALVEKSSGSTFLEISKRDLSALAIKLPSDPAEQTAIAEVLSDMDADLAALEAQAAKARAVKQGMMQELLTGRVRLV